MRNRKPKLASLDLVPDEVWVRALQRCVTFVLHHPRCGVLQDDDCDCVPMFVGSGFGIDNARPSA